jgi:hypothetical protein
MSKRQSPRKPNSVHQTKSARTTDQDNARQAGFFGANTAILHFSHFWKMCYYLVFQVISAWMLLLYAGQEKERDCDEKRE